MIVTTYFSLYTPWHQESHTGLSQAWLGQDYGDLTPQPLAQTPTNQSSTSVFTELASIFRSADWARPDEYRDSTWALSFQNTGSLSPLLSYLGPCVQILSSFLPADEQLPFDWQEMVTTTQQILALVVSHFFVIVTWGQF